MLAWARIHTFLSWRFEEFHYCWARKRKGKYPVDQEETSTIFSSPYLSLDLASTYKNTYSQPSYVYASSCFIMDEEIILIGQYGTKTVAACEQVALVSKDYDAILLRNGKWQNHLRHRPQVYPIILLLLLLLFYMGKGYTKSVMLDALYKETPTTPVQAGSVTEVCRQRSSSSLLKERMSKGNMFQPFLHVNYKYIGYCFFS